MGAESILMKTNNMFSPTTYCRFHPDMTEKLFTGMLSKNETKHTVGFHGEMGKIIVQLSSNALFKCSSVRIFVWKAGTRIKAEDVE